MHGIATLRVAKLKAEQAAQDFVEKLDESKYFKFIWLSIHPMFKVPSSVPVVERFHRSSVFIKILFIGTLPALPDFSTAVIDVCDAAAAHIAAMENSNANGTFLTKPCVYKGVLSHNGNEFRPQGYKITSRDLPKVAVWVGKFFSVLMKEMYACLSWQEY